MKHVVSLELAKKLVEAGIVVESYFWHHKKLHGNWTVLSHQERPYPWRKGDKRDDLPAPLVDELLEVLPPGSELCKCSNGYLAGIPMEHYESCGADTPEDALAQMLLWLKEKGLYETPKV